MERRAVINELKKLYRNIPPAKAEIFKEFILIIWLQNIQSIRINKKLINAIFTNYLGSSTLYNWTLLKEEILNDLKNNPDKEAVNFSMRPATNPLLSEVLNQFTHQKVLGLFIEKIGMQLEDFDMISLFLSYHVFTRDNQLFGDCYNTTRQLLRFFATFFKAPSQLSKYYILDRMIGLDKRPHYETLLYLKEDMVPDMMEEPEFQDQFEKYNEASFEDKLIRASHYHLLREENQFTLHPQFLMDELYGKDKIGTP